MMTPELLPEAPWGVLISLYFVLAGVAAGTTLVAAWLHHYDAYAAVRLTWRLEWLALATLSLCGGILIVDLGRPGRFFLMLTSFANPGSLMSVGAKLIAGKWWLLVVHLALLWRRRQALVAGDPTLAAGRTRLVYTVVPGLLAVASVCLAAYPALLLARTWLAPLATSSGAVLLFVNTALLMGVAVAAIGQQDEEFTDQLHGLMWFLGGTHLGLLCLAGLAAYDAAPAIEQALHGLVAGQAAPLFWSLVVGVGLGLPGLLLIIVRRRRSGMLVSALCLFVGAATLRLLLFSVA
jgi:formate-dependent nitrite reductase membrane component NrfD